MHRLYSRLSLAQRRAKAAQESLGRARRNALTPEELQMEAEAALG